MKTLPEPEDCQVDALSLRQAREARGLSVSEAARQVTLSRAQVDQIENGGCTAFYSLQHKVLAVRKYASALGLDPEAILAGPPAPEPEPEPEPAASVQAEIVAAEIAEEAPARAPSRPLTKASKKISAKAAAKAATPAEEPAELAAEAGAGEKSVPVSQPAVVEMPSVAASIAAVPGPLADRQAAATVMPAVTSPSAVLSPPAAVMMRSVMVGLLAAGALAIVFATIRGGIGGGSVGNPSEVELPVQAFDTEPASEPVAKMAVVSTEPPAALATVALAEPQPLTAAPAAEPAAGSGCGAAPDEKLPQWTPAYVRKPFTRLYIGGPAGTRVCVSDSAGKVSQLVLADGPMQAVSGRPPFVVRSSGLETLMMFMQGMKVKVPAQASAIRLLPGERTSIPDEAAAEATPES